MSNLEIIGLHRITKKHLKDLCKEHQLYQTPHLNDQLYLHFQGFQSIENLEEYTGLKCLWLESNAISEIQGLDCQSELKCLFLQNNLIRKIENLQCCSSLDTLNLSSNHITKIENCCSDILPVLSTLNLSKNYLRNYIAIEELVNCKHLCSLDLSDNRIEDVLVVKIFAKMPELRVLILQGNPVVSKIPQYRKTLILECKNLTYLDSRPVFPKDRACAEAWKRGGYEEERKESSRWAKLDRQKIRNSVNATLRLRQKYGAGDIQLLESSDDEKENKKNENMKKIPENGTSSGDLELTGSYRKPDRDLIESSDGFSADSSDDLTQENCIQELPNKNNNNKTEEKLEPQQIISDIIESVFEQDCKKEENNLQEISKEMTIETIPTDIDLSELQSSKIQKENEKVQRDDAESALEKNKNCRTGDEDLLQNATGTHKENDLSSASMSMSDFSEHNETTNRFSSTSLDSSLTNSQSFDASCSSKLNEITEETGHDKIENKVQYKKTESASSMLGFDEEVDAEIENSLQKSIESDKVNTSSLMSFSTSLSTDQDETTKSLLSSSSSESSSSDLSFYDGSSSNSIFEKEIVLNEDNKFEKENFEPKKTESKDGKNSKLVMDEETEIKYEDKLILQKSMEDNRQNDSSLRSLSTTNSSDQNETTKSLSSSSSSASSESSSLDDSSSDAFEINPSDEKELFKSKEAITNAESKLDKTQTSSPIKSCSSVLLAEETSVGTSLTMSPDNTEARLQNIFKMILTDEDSDIDIPPVSSQSLKEKTETEQLPDFNISSNYPPSEDHSTVAENETNQEQKFDEGNTDSIWYDRNWQLEDTIASKWLENFLTNECKNENSLAKECVEEINNNASCLALYDSSEWLDQQNNCEESEVETSEDIIVEIEETKGTDDSETTIEEKTKKKFKFTGEDPVGSYLNENLLKNEANSSNKQNSHEIFSERFLGEELVEFSHLHEESSAVIEDKEQISGVINEEKSLCKVCYKVKQSQNKDLENIEIDIEPKVTIQKIKEITEINPQQHFERDSIVDYNDEKYHEVRKNDELCRNTTEDNLLENNSQSLSWWERTLAAARIEMSNLGSTANGDNKKESEILKFSDERKVFEEEKKDVLEIPALEEQSHAEICLEKIVYEVNYSEDKGSSVENSPQKIQDLLEQQIPDKSSELFQKEVNQDSENSQNLDTDDLSYTSESSMEELSSISTLREVLTTFNAVAETIPSRNRQKSELFKELPTSSVLKTFSDQTSDEINRQIEELHQQKREQVSNLVDYVYAQREKYDDTLELVDGRLMVVKRSTGAVEELPPPPSLTSQRTGSSEYISCGVSTIATSFNHDANDDDDDDEDVKDDNDDDGGNSDEYGTALSSEDKDNNDDEAKAEESDIDQNASDTKIKSIPHCISSEVNYCANESVSLSSTDSSTDFEKIEAEAKAEEDNNHHHHLDDVDDDENSQLRASVSSGRLHNEIDSEVLPESSKWLEKEKALVASPGRPGPSPADYKLSIQEGHDAAEVEPGVGVRAGIQTSCEFQVDLNDSIQSFVDFGEQAATIDDISLIFKNPELDK